MHVGAIIAEFNPLHQGHLYLINKAKQNCDLLVVLLSGYFSQRGEPVCQDKWLRARDTIDAGADLVITHPVYTATSPAREFAEGSIRILTELPHIESIFFGLEQSGLEVYHQGLELLDEDSQYQSALKDYLNQGESYSVAMRKALVAINSDLFNLFQPNSILGLEYGKSLLNKGCLELIYPISRINSVDGNPLPSASQLRNQFNEDPRLKANHFQYNSSNMVNTDILQDELYQLYRGELLANNINLSSFLGYETGIENRLRKQAIDHTTSRAFFEHTKSKRYSIPRLKRLLLHHYLGINREMIHKFHRSKKALQVLGFNQKGQDYLKRCQDVESLYFITNYKQIFSCPQEVKQSYEMELKSSNLYYLINHSKFNQDMQRHPYMS